MTCIIQENVREPVTDKTDSSSCDLFVQVGFVQLCKEAAFSVQLRSTDHEQLSIKLGDVTKRKSFFLAQRFLLRE